MLSKFLFLLENDLKKENYNKFSIFSSELKNMYSIDIFDSLIIQPLSRKINDESIIFIGIKNIEIKEEYRSKNIFTEILNIIEHKEIPIFIDDIINNRLFQFLADRGYENIKHNSTYGWKRSMYKNIF